MSLDFLDYFEDKFFTIKGYPNRYFKFHCIDDVTMLGFNPTDVFAFIFKDCSTRKFVSIRYNKLKPFIDSNDVEGLKTIIRAVTDKDKIFALSL